MRDATHGRRWIFWSPAIWLVFTAGVFLGVYYLYFVRPEEVVHIAFIDIMFILVSGFAGAISLAVGVRAGRAGRPWIFIGLGCLCWWVGQLIWTTYDLVWRVPIPYPSAADFAFLLMHPLFAVGLVSLILRNTTGSPTFEVVLDSLIVATVSTIVTYQFLIEPLFLAGSESFVSLVVSVTTTAVNAGLLFITIVAFVWSPSWVDRRSLLILLCGSAAFSIADVIYILMVSEETYYLGHPVDLGWLFGFLLVAAAALLFAEHDHDKQAVIQLDDSDPTTLIRTAVIVASVLVGTWFSAYADLRDQSNPVAAGGVVAVGILLAARIAYSTHQSRQLQERTRERDRLYEERDRLYAVINAELERAAEIQAMFLPQSPPEVQGYELAGLSSPARHVGGDFYDWQRHNGSLSISLGDVMGKGIPASLLMATVRAALRAVSELAPAEVVTTVNKALCPDLIHSDSFITLFHAVLNLATGELRYVDAGHGLVFIQQMDGGVKSLRQRSLPLGLQADANYLEGRAMLEKGETMIIYSDGLPDARPELDLDTAGVARVVSGLTGVNAKIDRLVSLVGGAEARPDDVTLVLVSRQIASDNVATEQGKESVSGNQNVRPSGGSRHELGVVDSVTGSSISAKPGLNGS